MLLAHCRGGRKARIEGSGKGVWSFQVEREVRTAFWSVWRLVTASVIVLFRRAWLGSLSGILMRFARLVRISAPLYGFRWLGLCPWEELWWESYTWILDLKDSCRLTYMNRRAKKHQEDDREYKGGWEGHCTKWKLKSRCKGDWLLMKEACDVYMWGTAPSANLTWPNGGIQALRLDRWDLFKFGPGTPIAINSSWNIYQHPSRAIIPNSGIYISLELLSTEKWVWYIRFILHTSIQIPLVDVIGFGLLFRRRASRYLPLLAETVKSTKVKQNQRFDLHQSTSNMDASYVWNWLGGRLGGNWLEQNGTSGCKHPAVTVPEFKFKASSKMQLCLLVKYTIILFNIW